VKRFPPSGGLRRPDVSLFAAAVRIRPELRDEEEETIHALWAYRTEEWAGRNLIGYRVEAVDGEVGRVDDASNETDFSCLVVQTGPWIFGRKVVVPAALVGGIDDAEGKVFVDRRKTELKDAPEYHDDLFYDLDFRDELGRYYGRRQVRVAAGMREVRA
jgi:hypothetical protein